MTDPAARDGEWSDVRTLVLGATGFIGRWVVRALKRTGAEVVPHARDERRAREVLAGSELRRRMAVADLSAEGGAGDLLRRVRPDVVFNLVGYGVDPDEEDTGLAFRINSSLVRDLCEATEEHGRSGWPGHRLVHVGSALEYGEAAGDLSEETIPEPTTVYGRSKLAGTRRLRRYCRRKGLAGLTVRLFTVYGPGEHEGRLLPTLLRAAGTGDAVELTAGRQKRDFTYVEDVADGLLRLSRSSPKPGQVVNLATGRLTAVREFVLEAADVLGLSRGQLRFGAKPTREEEMEHEPVSTARLRSSTGWVPSTPVREGIRRTRDLAAGEGRGGSAGGADGAPEA